MMNMDIYQQDTKNFVISNDAGKNVTRFLGTGTSFKQKQKTGETR